MSGQVTRAPVNTSLYGFVSRMSEWVFYVFIIFILGLLVPFIKLSIEHSLWNQEKKPEGYEYTELKDLQFTAIGVFCCMVAKTICSMFAKPFIAEACKV